MIIRRMNAEPATMCDDPQWVRIDRKTQTRPSLPKRMMLAISHILIRVYSIASVIINN